MKPRVKKIFLLTAVFIPALFAFYTVFLGTVILWYDSARDLLSAWDNLTKPTLIGPTSGIPGIFYGPYWIWLLSGGLTVSKDPRVVTLIVTTIPYVLIFPLIWFCFKKYFGQMTLAALWLLFFFGFGLTYATQLWNPYPAPLLTLFLLFLLLNVHIKKVSLVNIVEGSGLGFILGLLINFHISFGLALTLGIFLFLLADTFLDFFSEKKHKAKFIIPKLLFFFAIGAGLTVAFTPFILFEIRHGFQQTHVLFNALLQYGAVIGLKGLTKFEIFTSFFEVLGKLLYVPTVVAGILFISVIGYFAMQVKKHKIKLDNTDQRILLLIFCLLGGISLIYFTARNPIWIYHFIGVEVIFLILIAFLSNKIPIIKYTLIGWASIVVVINIFLFTRQLSNPIPPSLVVQKEIVATITQDAKQSNYAVIAYEPSIYQYEFTYLFRWLANKNLPYDPTQTPSNANPIYLIVPTDDPEVRNNFIQYRTPDKEWDTGKSWEKPYKLEIIKRVKRS